MCEVVYCPGLQKNGCAKDLQMDYRGIRYTIRARIEREQWSVAIHPTGVEMKGRVVFGSREKAELQAHKMIDRWLKKHSTQKPNSNRHRQGERK